MIKVGDAFLLTGLYELQYSVHYTLHRWNLNITMYGWVHFPGCPYFHPTNNQTEHQTTVWVWEDVHCNLWCVIFHVTSESAKPITAAPHETLLIIKLIKLTRGILFSILGFQNLQCALSHRTRHNESWPLGISMCTLWCQHLTDYKMFVPPPLDNLCDCSLWLLCMECVPEVSSDLIFYFPRSLSPILLSVSK